MRPTEANISGSSSTHRTIGAFSLVSLFSMVSLLALRPAASGASRA
jgi:hypothetical protein